jgi:predicted enzyme related to lactoylglutathione lyase
LFGWTDIGVPDQEAGKAFYTSLFGWDADDQPSGPNSTYTMLQLDGKTVAGLYAQAPDQQQAGIPPAWLSYIAVDDLDAVTRRVGDLGGAIIAPPFDVMESGRMALITDPAGAMVALWEAKAHIGGEIFNVPGTMTWNELATNDVPAAKEFYGALLGWTFESSPMPDGNDYTTIKIGDRMNGGMMAMGNNYPPGTPPHWSVYFAVADADAAAATASELGGYVIVPPTNISMGRFTVLSDPQGGIFTAVHWTVPTD